MSDHSAVYQSVFNHLSSTNYLQQIQWYTVFTSNLYISHDDDNDDNDDDDDDDDEDSEKEKKEEEEEEEEEKTHALFHCGEFCMQIKVLHWVLVCLFPCSEYCVHICKLTNLLCTQCIYFILGPSDYNSWLVEVAWNENLTNGINI